MVYMTYNTYIYLHIHAHIFTHTCNTYNTYKCNFFIHIIDLILKENQQRNVKHWCTYVCSLETNYKHFVRITQRVKTRDVSDN